MRNFLIVSLLALTIQLRAQDSLSLLFIGDVMQHEPQITSAYNPATKKYEYDECFKYLKDYMSAADITIANLEVTLGGRPYSGYPMFSAPDALAGALKNAGVDVLVTANNHTCDRRKAGVIRTLDVLDSLQITHTGSFRNMPERELFYPLLIEKNGFRLALLNYTYGTNGMPVEAPTVVNLIDEEMILNDLEKARSMQVDKIIAFMHWGSEYTHVPNAAQKKIADVLMKNGADIVIGAHPHVVQPMHHLRTDSSEKVIAYSLGNFISNQRTAPRDGGAMFRLQLVKDADGTVSIQEAGYVLTWVWLPTIGGKRKYFVMPAAEYETDRREMDAGSHAKMKLFISGSRKLFNAENTHVKEFKYSPEGGWQFVEE